MDYADAHAYLTLLWQHVSGGTFSHVADHLIECRLVVRTSGSHLSM